MPWYRVDTMFVHLKLACKAAKNPPAQCRARHTWSNSGIAVHHCCAMATLLCDHINSDGKTCDAPLCEEHATLAGPDFHLCPLHVKQREARA